MPKLRTLRSKTLLCKRALTFPILKQNGDTGKNKKYVSRYFEESYAHNSKYQLTRCIVTNCRLFFVFFQVHENELN